MGKSRQMNADGLAKFLERRLYREWGHFQHFTRQEVEDTYALVTRAKFSQMMKILIERKVVTGYSYKEKVWVVNRKRTRCARCKRKLTDSRSVERGMGPSCYRQGKASQVLRGQMTLKI